VNRHVSDGDAAIPTLKIDHSPEQGQRERVTAVKARRDGARARACIEALERAARGDENLMPAMLEAVRCDVTLGEVSDVFRRAFGEHRDPAYL
jgi:methylmalonyl-CoA mutase N-terminal domain/subunit